jgi:Na+/H+ antiporter NhaD/arsenite permease-like protein
LLPAWLVAVGLLLAAFGVMDYRNRSGKSIERNFTGDMKIEGSRNFIWLLLLIGTVFLDPAKLSFLPSINGHSFVRELLQIGIAVVAFRRSDKEALYYNRFTFEPMLEVAFVFFGIFFAMMPALQLLETFVSTPGNLTSLTPSQLYWATGVCSSLLDNAPSYLTFLTTAMTFMGFSISDAQQVIRFATEPATVKYLLAISTSAVFFGAMTYIGNGPNFMVKSIAEESKRELPGFVGYTTRYAIPILLPVLVIVWFLFIW